VADLKRHAGELGLDQPAFDRCLDSGETAPRWQRGQQDGSRYGVNGTPSFFVNGRYLSGALSFAAFAQIVDEELARVAVAGAAAR
jgi:protein-disulfide isomerase